MQELEKILEEIIKKCFCVEIREYQSETVILLDDVEGILEKYMNGGWISVDDRRLWDILLEEAYVEGKQEKIIYNRLKKISSYPYQPERSEE